MPDNVTNELLLEHLKRLQNGQSMILARIETIEAELRSAKACRASIMKTLIEIGNKLDAAVASLADRLKRRPDLREDARSGDLNP